LNVRNEFTERSVKRVVRIGPPIASSGLPLVCQTFIIS
jgi:hypothetical protein